MTAIKNISGKTFGFLTVKSFFGVDNHNNKALWNCICVCGNEVKAYGINLRFGNKKSCGCKSAEMQRAAISTHGESRKAREYRIWQAMKQRCYNAKSDRYVYYGARGIKICDRWINSYENFIADMGPAPSAKHSIDRKENDGNYEPDNCRWATQSEQLKNRRHCGRNIA